MLEVYLFETAQNLEQLETAILACEGSGCFPQEAINEIFRLMHTIKGSSAMMLFNDVAALAHRMEDLFYLLREQKTGQADPYQLSDLVLSCVDFIKLELQKIKHGDPVDGDNATLLSSIASLLAQLQCEQPVQTAESAAVPGQKQQYYLSSARPIDSLACRWYKATLFFTDDCQMVNVRAYTVIHSLKELTEQLRYYPADIIDNDASAEVIAKQGFTIYACLPLPYVDLQRLLQETLFLQRLELVELLGEPEESLTTTPPTRLVEESVLRVPRVQAEQRRADGETAVGAAGAVVNPNLISVDVGKLDKLMDLVGEMVIAEAMVTQNPDLAGLELDNFAKAARQLHKITSELQDSVMSIRMVPLAATFQKMQRIVRDMSKKLAKEVHLELIGEETEVDKNIIEHISDPLMHLIRNAVDHGLETADGRAASGKPRAGTITLEAKNAGSDVLVVVRDDGQGLNREKILQRAREGDLLPERELSDQEVYNLIMLPGFSTKDQVSEFSGRGVGMDVVVKNLEKVGGVVAVESQAGTGTAITMKIPLTLAIIDGMNLRVGRARYTVPTTAIRESFRPAGRDLINDPDGNELVMVRGDCYPILRLHRRFSTVPDIDELDQGILIRVEQDGRGLCLFADELLGQQQVVVKALPEFVRESKRGGGLAGCTVLGDGGISLILDVAGLIKQAKKELWR